MKTRGRLGIIRPQPSLEAFYHRIAKIVGPGTHPALAEFLRSTAIARHLGVHHSTVTHGLEGAGVPREATRRRSKLDPFLPFIQQTLERFPRLAASLLYRMLCKRGYRGGEDHVRHRVAKLRPHRPSEAYLELRTLPGEQGQVDWASFGTWPVEGGERRLSAFVMVLSYSRHLFFRFFLDQRMTSFLEGHVDAFAFFGGVPRTLLYDNLKSAVLERLGDAIRFHPAMLELSSHYRFQPRPVAPGRGNEKGRCERAIGYLRTSFFPALSFSSLDDLNRKALAFSLEVAATRPWPQQRSLTVEQAITAEKPHLLQLPAEPFPAAERVAAPVGKTPYVRFDSNRYSVPHTLVRRPVTLLVSSRKVRIFDGSQLVAVHERCWGKQQVVEDPDHIAKLRERKRLARLHRDQDRLLRAVPACERLLDELARRNRRLHHAVQSLVLLLDEFGPVELTPAVLEALASGSPHPETVRLVLDRQRRVRLQPPPVPVKVPDEPKVRSIVVTPHDLSTYDPDDGQEESDD